MSIVNTKKMLRDAQQGKYAVGAFNVSNMEYVQSVIWAAEELRAPVIIQTSASTTEYGTPKLFYHMVEACAEDASVPVAIHLDHGKTFDNVMACIHGGYKSVMFDGSTLPYCENVEKTKAIATICKELDVSIEAELGVISGTTDLYTDPETAADFVEKTGVDSLAVAIGTVHGIYKSEPRLDYERLSMIRSAVDVPLVLHGGTGLSAEQMQECIKRGIAKVNVATELQLIWAEEVKRFMEQNPAVFDPKKILKEARACIKNAVMDKIRILGSDHKV